MQVESSIRVNLKQRNSTGATVSHGLLYELTLTR